MAILTAMLLTVLPNRATGLWRGQRVSGCRFHKGETEGFGTRGREAFARPSEGLLGFRRIGRGRAGSDRWRYARRATARARGAFLRIGGIQWPGSANGVVRAAYGREMACGIFATVSPGTKKPGRANHCRALALRCLGFIRRAARPRTGCRYRSRRSRP